MGPWPRRAHGVNRSWQHNGTLECIQLCAWRSPADDLFTCATCKFTEGAHEKKTKTPPKHLSCGFLFDKLPADFNFNGTALTPGYAAHQVRSNSVKSYMLQGSAMKHASGESSWCSHCSGCIGPAWGHVS